MIRPNPNCGDGLLKYARPRTGAEIDGEELGYPLLTYNCVAVMRMGTLALHEIIMSGSKQEAPGMGERD